MNYVLYNSNNVYTKKNKNAHKLYKKLAKVDPNLTYLLTFSEIENKEVLFVNQLKEYDTIYLCGGDGTLDLFLNKIIGATPKCKILFYSSGTANDFRKDFKNEQKFIDITPNQGKWPRLIVNGIEEYIFVNGCGMGIDAAACRSKAQYAMSGNKKGYFSIAYKAIKSFRYFSVDILIDDVKLHYDNVSFFVFNIGKYFGNGMKIAPNANRDSDELTFVIVHDVTKRMLSLLLPLVYLGLHTLFKKNVDVIKCKNAIVKTDGCMLLQRDGETLDYVKKIEVFR